MKKLAKLANSTLLKLREKSTYKDKISVASHDLEDFGIGKTHNKRYTDCRTGFHDGVHYFGPGGSADYTRSLSGILQVCLPVLSLPPSESSSIPSNNRFSILSEGNC